MATSAASGSGAAGASRPAGQVRPQRVGPHLRYDPIIVYPLLSDIIGHFGQVQADLRRVVTFLEAIVATQSQPEDAQPTLVKTIISRDGKLVNKLVEQVEERMGNVKGLWVTDPGVARYRYELADIYNLWQEIPLTELTGILNLVPAQPAQPAQPTAYDGGAGPAAAAPAPAPDETRLTLEQVSRARRRARTLLPAYKELRRRIGRFTIPMRVQHFIGELVGVGTPMDFHNRFKDELEDPVDRVDVLRELAGQHVDLVGGIADPERGMIYRAGTRARRLLSYLLMPVVAVIGGVIVLSLSSSWGWGFLDIPGFARPAAGANEAYSGEILLRTYILTIVGVFFHIVKKSAEFATVERTKGAEGEPLVSLDRLLDWIHVREWRFVWSVVTAILAYIGLVAMGQLTEVNAALVGYTVDSISDSVFQRVNTPVSAYARQVKQAFAPVPPPSGGGPPGGPSGGGGGGGGLR